MFIFYILFFSSFLSLFPFLIPPPSLLTMPVCQQKRESNSCNTRAMSLIFTVNFRTLAKYLVCSRRTCRCADCKWGEIHMPYAVPCEFETIHAAFILFTIQPLHIWFIPQNSRVYISLCCRHFRKIHVFTYHDAADISTEMNKSVRRYIV